MPMLRGKGKLTSLAKRPVILNLTDLASFASGSNVTSQALVRNGLVTEKEARSQGVKILGRGTVTKKLTVSLPVSIAARKKIEKAGGKVIEEKILASQKEQTPRSKS
jgi:large subunit ribosomal protein L15